MNDSKIDWTEWWKDKKQSSVVFRLVVLIGPPEGQHHAASAVLPRVGCWEEPVAIQHQAQKVFMIPPCCSALFKPSKFLPVGSSGQNKLASHLQESGNGNFIACVKHKINFIFILSSCF